MRYKWIFLLIPLTWLACEDIIVPDISSDKLTLLAPTDTLVTTNTSILFWWDELHGAEYYHLQIVKPDFNMVEKFYYDTLIRKDRFTVLLQPGNYAWRICAENSQYATSWIYGVLQIDSTANLANQEIHLLNPADKDTTNITQFTFRWRKLYNADEYNFVIKTSNQNGATVVAVKIPDTSFTYTLNEGAFAWGVQGVNSSSQTPFEYRGLYIDITDPGKPSLLAPSNLAVIPDSIINFSWSRPVTGGSSITDSLLIFSDSLYTNLVRQLAIKKTHYADSLGVGKFYWTVKSVDKAGNASPFSNVRSFTIQ